MSTLEFQCALALIWSDLVVDLYEHYPLHDLEETQAIATELGYKHPQRQRTYRGRTIRFDDPLTTDLLVELAPGHGLPAQLAVSVMPASTLVSDDREVMRRLERAEIERRYWKRRDVGFQIVTEIDLPAPLIANIKLVYNQDNLDGYGFDEARVPEMLDYLFFEIWSMRGVALKSICKAADVKFGLKRGASLTLVWHAIATKRWCTDMHQPIDPDAPLSIWSGTIEGSVDA